ncbi:MAG: hypothetical protein R3C18_21995 [Planctomycetaceae bacterium]
MSGIQELLMGKMVMRPEGSAKEVQVRKPARVRQFDFMWLGNSTVTMSVRMY